MAEEAKQIACKEIRETLKLCNFCLSKIGLSPIGIPKTTYEKFRNLFTFVFALILLLLMLVGEYVFIVLKILSSPSIEELLGSLLHVSGYDTMSIGKLLIVWYKRNTFRQLVTELEQIWPVKPSDEKETTIKRERLSTLKQRQHVYATLTICGIWFYNLTPIVIFLYNKLTATPTEKRYIWQIAYPFDKSQPGYYHLVYLYEIAAGLISVFCMWGTDQFFMTMCSHMSMLLNMLQVKIRNLTKAEEQRDVGVVGSYDCYQEIVSVVKLHQRLINYINDLEDAFCAVNLINVLLSSVNICCVVFDIIFLVPWISMGNKFYLVTMLMQMGVVCWYADDICRASVGVSDAVYESDWYRCNVRSRRALLVMLQRSQKPLHFTALKFRAITMTTYSSILTTSYSYFTLIYSSYSK